MYVSGMGNQDGEEESKNLSHLATNGLFKG